MDFRPAVGAVVMSLDLARGAWPISALVLAAAVWGAYKLVRARKLQAWQSITVLCSSVFPAIVVPIYTVRFWADPRIHSPSTQEAPLNILGAGWILFALAVAVSIYFARGFRLPLSGLASVVIWFAAGMYLLSAMAISGVWL
jgi:hypothetical protein